MPDRVLKRCTKAVVVERKEVVYVLNAREEVGCDLGCGRLAFLFHKSGVRVRSLFPPALSSLQQHADLICRQQAPQLNIGISSCSWAAAKAVGS
jgi:hypothetical protein